MSSRQQGVVITHEITSSGNRIGPGEIENCLLRHPAVGLAAVIGVPDEQRTEIVKAFIVLKEGAQATTEELVIYCKAHLAKYKVPSVVEVVESLPKSAVGKVLRRELREAEEAKRKG